MLKVFQLITYFLVALLAVLPFVWNLVVYDSLIFKDIAFAVLHLVLASALLYYLIDRNSLRNMISHLASQVGLTENQSVFNTLKSIEHEVGRNYDVLSARVLERKITDKNQLADTLEELVTAVYKFLGAKSAELALYDSDSGLYHSALVLGAPANSAAQAMLSDAIDGKSETVSADIMIQPILFAGSTLGSIRISLKDQRVPTESDWKFLKAMSLQSGLAILNAEYSKQLLKMKMSSEDSLKAKTGFLATLSHEIRGPLGVMLNAAELVLDGLCGDVNEDQIETLSMIKTNGAHLLELVNDVLDYAKVESGKLTPKPEIIKALDILVDISKVVKAQAEVKKHQLRVIPCDKTFAFSCDRRHARQILINLLTNAIKYTPDGGLIEMSAQVINGFLQIRVKDSGVGIAEEDHPKVFSAFERIDNSYSSKQIGTGLGMSLTQSLVKANEGNIGFESELGKGSTFWISFPVEIEKEDSSYVKEEEPDAVGLGEAILVVETEDGERKMMARYLEHIGFTAFMAKDQAQAIALATQEKIRLVVVDNRVFDQKEYQDQELVRLIKASANKMPMVLLSSKAFVFDIEKALKSGVDVCLVKPFGLKKLGILVRQLLDGEVKTDIEETMIEDSLRK